MEAYIQQTKPPFCYEYYNVGAWYHTSIDTMPLITRICNSLIEALNKYIYLPKYVIILIDKDIVVSQVERNVERNTAMKNHLHWLIKQVSEITHTRREDLKIHNPSLASTEPTRIIWIKMLTRPLIENSSLCISKLGVKFNDTMETIIKSNKYMQTFAIKNMEDKTYFDIKGNLTTRGKKAFWQNLNDQLKAIDVL